MPSPPPAPLPGKNPFADVDLLVSDVYATRVQASVEAAGGISTALGRTLAKAAGIPTGIWIDQIGALPKMREALGQARLQQRGTVKCQRRCALLGCCLVPLLRVPFPNQLRTVFVFMQPALTNAQAQLS